MVSSLVLLFSESTQLKVEKISAFGNELLIGKPQAITIVLWVATFYWLIRYYQYAQSTHRRALKNGVQGRINETCITPALSGFLKRHEDWIYVGTDKTNPTCHVYATRCDVITIDPKYLDVKLSLERTVQTDSRISRTMLGSHDYRVEGMNLYWLRLKSFFYCVIHTPLYTEIVLPYIVFSLPVVYVGLKFAMY
jgi:hypothetical protein